MCRVSLFTMVLGVVALSLVLPAPAESQQKKEQAAPKANVQTALTAYELSARIDSHIAQRWQKERVVPVELCADATFFRRVHLDLIGKIPTILDIRDFLDDDRPDKRKIWIDKLLQTEAHNDHFANVYRQIILNNAENEQTVFFSGGFESWLRQKLKGGSGYDRIVREVLNPSNSAGGRGLSGLDASAGVFYVANNKPEDAAGAAARLFLGAKIECAQCHKHPFAPWTRTQFWEFAAFFTGMNEFNNFVPVDENGNPIKVATPKPPPSLAPQILIPKTDQWVQAKFLDGRSPEWKAGMNARKVLADWITAPENAQFAKVAVNQLWHYFLGTGLVDPVDDLGTHNLASHPELLDELAAQFIKNGYDLKYLTRAIVNSRAYQLSSAPLPANQQYEDEPRLFARMPLRALTGEQLFDSLAEVMEYKVDRTPQAFRGLPSTRDEFVAKFSNLENRRIDTHTSILQALHLMNGKFTSSATSLDRNKTLATISQQKTGTAKKIELLYLVALTRLPTATESARLVRYVDSGGPTRDGTQAIADVFWALLNSVEFSMNH